MNTGTPHRIILDTDPGIDDALAILLALASPEVSLEAITVTGGNCSLEQGVANALNVLALAGAPHVPVAAGVGVPLVRPPVTAPETHGETGLGYARLPAAPQRPAAQHAVDLIIERVLAAPGEITIVAIAPLTNLALAVRREPRIVQAVRAVIVMGGALRHQGNMTPVAEFNTYVDPHAAHIVYHAGWPLTLVPLDVTYQCILTQADVTRLSALKSPITRFIADATRFYMQYHEEAQGIEGCVINDPLALALAFAPALVVTRPLYVTVDTSSELGMGNTIGDFYRAWQRPPNMHVALEVRARDFIELFMTRIEHWVRRRPAHTSADIPRHIPEAAPSSQDRQTES
ncbi:MAG TPA: nucleoside hydrolase [Caldilineaceae bacterium]|nr:nucleoside hydrolase [Caldilineaceae bacterium]